MKRLVKMCFILVAGIVLITGCAGNKEILKTTPMQEIDSPEWVMKGSGAFDEQSGKIFYGVGSAANMKNSSLLRTAAGDRARSELAKTFQFYTASLMKDYQASTVAGDPNTTSDEQHVEQAIKTVTSMTLSGVEIVDHWQNPATMELFALARLDLESFKNNFNKMRELDKKVKAYIKENADKLHEQLEKEEAKMGGN